VDEHMHVITAWTEFGVTARRACRRARSKMGRILMIDFHVF
jgi:hypothetical protein